MTQVKTYFAGWWIGWIDAARRRRCRRRGEDRTPGTPRKGGTGGVAGKISRAPLGLTRARLDDIKKGVSRRGWQDSRKRVMKQKIGGRWSSLSSAFARNRLTTSTFKNVRRRKRKLMAAHRRIWGRSDFLFFLRSSDPLHAQGRDRTQGSKKCEKD